MNMQHATPSALCIANVPERSVLIHTGGRNKYLRDFRSRAATDKESPAEESLRSPTKMHIARNQPITHLYLDPGETSASAIRTN